MHFAAQMAIIIMHTQYVYPGALMQLLLWAPLVVAAGHSAALDMRMFCSCLTT
jgi:hypothetical protein